MEPSMRDFITADDRLDRMSAADRESEILNIASNIGTFLVAILLGALVIYHTILR